MPLNVGLCSRTTGAMLFPIVNSIISPNLEPIAKTRGWDADQLSQAMQGHSANMSRQWRCDSKPIIPYEDPLCRLAYLYHSVPAQANLFCEVLKECRRDSESFARKLTSKRLPVFAFGGGPGTELLGLAKYFHDRARYERHEQIKVSIDLVDRVQEWLETVRQIDDQISEFYSKQFGSMQDWPARLSPFPYSFSFSQVDRFANLPSLFQSELFVLNYVLSEVFDLDELLPLMREMVAACAVGAHFLLIDRSDNRTVTKMGALIDALQLHVDARGSIIDNMDANEDKSEVKALSEFLGGWQPRLKWRASWILAVKPLLDRRLFVVRAPRLVPQ